MVDDPGTRVAAAISDGVNCLVGLLRGSPASPETLETLEALETAMLEIAEGRVRGPSAFQTADAAPVQQLRQLLRDGASATEEAHELERRCVLVLLGPAGLKMVDQPPA